MSYTLGEAAKATGKSKPTIQRAIKSGKISASKEIDGSYSIEPVELYRVFPALQRDSNVKHQMKRSVTPDDTPVGELKAKLESAETRIRDKDAVIDDLRRRLDVESEERRKLTALLTDRSAEKPPQEPAQGRLSRAWSILTGKS